jgi:hypothetical protein
MPPLRRPCNEARIRRMNLRSPATLTVGARSADDLIIWYKPNRINNIGSRGIPSLVQGPARQSSSSRALAQPYVLQLRLNAVSVGYNNEKPLQMPDMREEKEGFACPLFPYRCPHFPECPLSPTVSMGDRKGAGANPQYFT